MSEASLVDWRDAAHDVFDVFHRRAMPQRSPDTYPVFVGGRYVGNVQRMMRLWQAFDRRGGLHSYGHETLQAAVDALEASHDG